MRQYCVGFAFNSTRTEVLLLRKEKPDWQKNRCNGIGGHIEEGESALEAMQREAVEEVGSRMHGVTWTEFAELSSSEFELHCFFTIFDEVEWNNTSWWDFTADGEFFVANVDRLPDTVLENLRWLIPLAIDSARETGTGPHTPPSMTRTEYER